MREKFTDNEIVIGSHVYHTGVEANGIVVDFDDTKKNQFKVHFPWAKYSNILHGRWTERGSKGTKWQWCSEDSLVKLDMPIDMGGLGQNTVRLTGKRSLDRLIRIMTGFRPWGVGKYKADILVHYGTGGFKKRSDTKLVINEHLISDKYRQMKIMGEELCPESQNSISPLSDKRNWIIKPYHSIGGKGIRPATEGIAREHEYYQRKFDKVREFRVHCFMWLDNPVPFIQEKVIGNKDQLCWNKKQGGKFRYVYQEGLEYGKFNNDLSKTSRKMMAKMAVEALDKLGYDFGGIDFGMNSSGQFKIFEVNSRMGLRERSFFTYKQAFAALKTLNIAEYRGKVGH